MTEEKVLCLYQDLIDIADGVREKDGDTKQYSFSELKNKIVSSYTGKVTLPDLSNPATYADLREGKQLIDENGAIVTGAMPEVDVATPTISVGADGLVTVNSVQPEGYVEAEVKTTTRQLTTQGEKTYTPGAANQYIAAQQYLTGIQTIKGDGNLIAENIKSGVKIFGVEGSLNADGVKLPELSNPGAADDLVVGKELIDGAGNVVVGTNPYEKYSTDAEVNEQTELLAQAIAALEGKAAGSAPAIDYTEEFNEYDEQLDELESAIDGLPSAGDSVETCTVTVTWSKAENGTLRYQAQGIPSVAYINSNGEMSTVAGAMSMPMKADWTATIECMCGSSLLFTQGSHTNAGISYTVSKEIVMSTMLPVGNSNTTDVYCVLPNTAGEYRLDVYYN